MEPSRSICRFCGRPGASREHVIPRWVGRVLTPELPPGFAVRFVHETLTPADEPEKPKRAKLPAWFTRAFCRACNGGWMAQLEEATRPVLGPMIRSRPTTLLGEREQRLLTLWATKTALAFQTMELTSTQWALPEDFATLHARSEPPPGSQVWLGAREQFYPAWYRAHSLSRDRSAIDVVDGYSVVLTVGFAVFFLIVSRDPQVQVRLRGEGALAMAPIWPRRREHVRWPPARLLAPIDLTRLPHRLLRDAALRPRGSEASG